MTQFLLSSNIYNMGNSSSQKVKSVQFDRFFETLPSMVGKRVLITGTTTGIGNVVAKSIATLGGNLVLLNRKSERADNSIAQLKSDFPDIEITSIECDLTSFSSVRKAADDYKKLFGGQGLDVLANNAGIMAFDDVATGDGFDIQMQTNHLSHFILTSELLSELEIAAHLRGESRIVNQSSGNRKRPSKNLESKFFQKLGGNLGGNSAKARYLRYQQSKLANAVFGFALHDVLQEASSSIKSVVCHPGITATGLQATSSKSGSKIMLKMLSRIAQSPEDGAHHLIQCMCGVNVHSGEFWGPSRNSIRGPTKKFIPETLCTSSCNKVLLIEESEKSTGVCLRVGAPLTQ